MQSGPGFVPTFLYYFVGTTFIALFVLSKGLESTDLATLPFQPFQLALLCGLTAGGMGAFFNSYEQLEFPLKNRGGDLKRVKQVLENWGYAEAQTVDQVTVYERPFPSRLFAGKVLVQEEPSTLLIMGRASRIRALKRQLGVQESP